MDKEILRHLRHHRDLVSKLFKTDVFIAGGALRDLDHDKPIKDIDLFIPCLKNSRNEHRQAIESPQFSYIADLARIYRVKPKILGANYKNWTGIRLFNVVEIPHKPYPIQIIFYNHGGRLGPRTLIDRFDINLCRIVDTGETILRAAEYKLDRNEKKITVNPLSHFTKEKVRERIARLLVKYPGYEVPEIPEPQAEADTLDDSAINRLYQQLNINPVRWTYNIVESEVTW